MIFESLTNAVGESVVDGSFDSVKLVFSFRLDAERVTNDLLGAPVKDDCQVQPAPGGDFDFGHVDALDGVRLMRTGLGARRSSASGTEALLRGNQQVVLFHNAVNTVDAGNVALAVFKIGPDSTVAPERVVRLDGHD